MTLFNFIKKELCRYLEHYEGVSTQEQYGFFQTVYLKVNPDSLDFNKVVRALCVMIDGYKIEPGQSRWYNIEPKLILKNGRKLNEYDVRLSWLISRFINKINELDKTANSTCQDELRDSPRRFIYYGLSERWEESRGTHLQGWWVRVSYLTKGVAFQELEGALEGD